MPCASVRAASAAFTGSASSVAQRPSASLRHVLADIERGTLAASRVAALSLPCPRRPTLHEFAEEWWVRNEGAARRQHPRGLPLATGAAPPPVLRRTPARPDRRSTSSSDTSPAKLAEAEPLSARSINMTVTLLAAVLDAAVERGSDPAKPCARSWARESASARPDGHTSRRPGQIAALLEAAGAMDAPARADPPARSAPRDARDLRVRRTANRGVVRPAVAGRRSRGRMADGRRVQDGRRQAPREGSRRTP